MKQFEHEYSYRFKRRSLVAWGIFCVVGVIVFAYQGATNDRGLEIRGPILLSFSKDGATIFYWLAAVTCFVFAGASAYLLKLRQRIAINEKWLHCPQSWWSTAEERIAYCDMIGIKMGRQTYLTSDAAVVFIHYRGGIRAISAAFFPTEHAFGEFWELLRDRFNACHPETTI